MLTNAQMEAGVLRRRANGMKAKKLLAKIEAHCAKGGQVAVCSYSAPKLYKSADWFVAGWDGLYVKRGKALDSLAFSPIRFV